MVLIHKLIDQLAFRFLEKYIIEWSALKTALKIRKIFLNSVTVAKLIHFTNTTKDIL